MNYTQVSKNLYQWVFPKMTYYPKYINVFPYSRNVFGEAQVSPRGAVLTVACSKVIILLVVCLQKEGLFLFFTVWLEASDCLHTLLPSAHSIFPVEMVEESYSPQQA